MMSNQKSWFTNNSSIWYPGQQPQRVPSANPSNPSVPPPGFVPKGPSPTPTPLGGIIQNVSDIPGEIIGAGGNLLSGLTMPLTIGLAVGGVALILILSNK